MFQFQCGTIDSWSPTGLFGTAFDRFNSSAVRLIEAADHHNDLLIQFQFQCGTIDSWNRIVNKLGYVEFQFQCGTIDRYPSQ